MAIAVLVTIAFGRRYCGQSTWRLLLVCRLRSALPG
jgi:hypothetical protein